MKKIFCLSIFLFLMTLVFSADEAAAVKLCIESSTKAGMTFNFNEMALYCSSDYVKIDNQNKVVTRVILERSARFFQRLSDPGLTFEELITLNAENQGRTLSDADRENAKKVDQSGDGKRIVQQTRAHLQRQIEVLKENIPVILKNTVYSEPVFYKNYAVIFYQGNFGVAYKGVVLLRKEKGSWKIYREMMLEMTGSQDTASEQEVRDFVMEYTRRTADFSKYPALLESSCAKTALSVMHDGAVVTYSQTEKLGRFLSLLIAGTPPLAEVMPLLIEGRGGTVTPEMLKNYQKMDLTGQGREQVLKLRQEVQRQQAKTQHCVKEFRIEHIFFYQDLALVLEHSSLPSAGPIEGVTLIRKEAGKYLYHKSVSRKRPALELP